MSTNAPTALRRLLTVSFLMLLSAPALAHPGHDERDHALSGVDPLLLSAILLAVVVVVGVLAFRLARRQTK